MIVILVVGGDSPINKIYLRTRLQTHTVDCMHESVQAYQRVYENHGCANRVTPIKKRTPSPYTRRTNQRRLPRILMEIGKE